MSVHLPGDVARQVVGEGGAERAGVVDAGDPFARVVGVRAGGDIIAHCMGGDITGSGVGVGGQRGALRVPHAAELAGAVVGIARLGAVGIDQAGDAAGKVVHVGDRLVAGQAVYGHLLYAHVAQVVEGVAVDDFCCRVGISVFFDLYEAPLCEVGPATRGTATNGTVVVVGHAAAPGGVA